MSEDPVLDKLRLMAWRIDQATKAVNHAATKTAARLAKKAKAEEGKRQVSGDEMTKLVDFWAELYYQHVGVKPAFNSRTFKAGRDILLECDLDEAKAAVAKAWADPWYATKLKQLWSIASDLNKYRVQVRPEPKKLEPGFTAPWDDRSTGHVDAADSIEEMNRKLGV